MRPCVLLLLLASGCTHYWVRNAPLDRLDVLDSDQLAHVAVPAVRAKDGRSVHLRGSFIHPETSRRDRPGWQRVAAYTGGLPAGITLLGLGGTFAIPGAIVMGLGSTNPPPSGCDGSPVCSIAGASLLAIGGVALLLGTIFTFADLKGRPQERVNETHMSTIDEYGLVHQGPPQ